MCWMLVLYLHRDMCGVTDNYMNREGERRENFKLIINILRKMNSKKKKTIMDSDSDKSVEIAPKKQKK